ncbi:serine/threonine-protein kinase [Limnoglobus roseus]|uniref:Serine/threonine protein kinase n=1 Tax=Limnoglobus roseus TaxID=2598579 RepID=A0A5C1AQ26_9BACT|nr:serine/threonine-protein kinase [Limnoglobus roseus]QEL20153.1 serine/threonine protein kinase [Limnoglobus roseus]
MPTPNPLDQTQDWQPADLDRTHDYSESPPKKAPTKVLLTTLGDFRLVGKLGEGGMGTVFKAVQVSRNRLVALKVLSKELAQRPGFVERFHREVRVMGKLGHPHIVKLLAAGEDHGFIYLAMELLDGSSIGSWLTKLGRLPVGDAALVAKSCGLALQYAHEAGMVHRDVKPDNLLLAKSRTVKLADLGLAKTADDSDIGLTQTGVGIGTPLYAAPEQARDAKHVDARSDLYSLGSVFYHCLTGKPPFHASNLLDIIKAKEKGVYATASLVNKKVPPALDRILAKMIAKVPDHRYPSVAEFLQELEWSGLVGKELSFLPGESDRETVAE